MKPQFRNLIFEGGGVKGIAYVGAMQVLSQRGLLDDIRRAGGASAGANNPMEIFKLLEYSAGAVLRNNGIFLQK